MVRPILDQVTTLTERAEVRQPIVGWIAVEMRRRKHDMRHPEPCGLYEVGPPRDAALTISPCPYLLIEPPAVRQTADESEMWSPTALTLASRALEANVAAQLMPVRWIEQPQFRTYRHGYATCLPRTRSTVAR